MEEKRVKIGNIFRSFYGAGNFFRFFSSTRAESSNPQSLLKNQDGLTLVELVVVVGVLGVMAVAGLTFIRPDTQLKKSRDSQRKSDMKVIQSALELYRSDNGKYPEVNGDDIPGVANCPASNSTSLLDDSTDTTCQTPESDTVFLQTVPTDPKTGLEYYYCRTTANPACGAPSTAGYALFACLENGNDTDGITAPTPVSTAVTCSSTKFYKVTNP